MFKKIALAAITIAPAANAVTLTVGGIVDTINGFDGSVIADGSLAQLGYFVGVSAAKDPTTFTQMDWDAFQEVASFTTGTVTITGTPGGINFAGTTFDSDTDFAPGDLPARMGVRIFDNLESGRFNTFTIVGENPVLEVAPVSPTPGDNEADLTTNSQTLVWEDSASPFQTTIPIPEPSTALLSVFALGFLARRRR